MSLKKEFLNRWGIRAKNGKPKEEEFIHICTTPAPSPFLRRGTEEPGVHPDHQRKPLPPIDWCNNWPASSRIEGTVANCVHFKLIKQTFN